MWGLVRIVVMKVPMMLKASSSIQAHSSHLSCNEKIEFMERGKQRSVVNS